MSQYRAYFVPGAIDPLGQDKQTAPGVQDHWFNWDPIISTSDFVSHYLLGNGEHLTIPASDIAELLNDSNIREDVNLDSVLSGMTSQQGLSCNGKKTVHGVSGRFKLSARSYGGIVGNTLTSITTDKFHSYGNTTIWVTYSGLVSIYCACTPKQIRSMTFKGAVNYTVEDRFANPTDIGGAFNEDETTDPLGTPYGFSGIYSNRNVDVRAEYKCGSPPDIGDGEKDDRDDGRGCDGGDSR